MPRFPLSSLPLPQPLRRLIPRRWSGDSQNSVAEFMEYRTRLVSPLMRRILLVNTLPLGLLALTLLYLTQFQNSLLEAEVSALREQARIYAGALGHSAMATARHDPVLEPALARPLLLRLTEPSPSAHARLFAPDGQVVADSRADQPVPPGAPVRATPLSSTEEEDHSSPPLPAFH